MTYLRHLLASAALLLATVAPAPAHAVDEKDLLPVDEAFVLSASAPARGRIELHWQIADGYYLYRHRIGAQPVDSGLSNSTPKFNPLQLPPGKKKTDEFFGEVETYRHALTAVLTGAAATGVDAIELRVKYQGCADLGVCYPPQTRTLTVALPQDSPPPQLSPASGGGSSDGLDALGRSLAGGSNTPSLPGLAGDGSKAPPLPPEQAFGVDAIAADGNTLLLRFTPAPGYYLYRDKTRLKLDAGAGSALAGITLDRPRWPKGVSHRDEHFGDVIVYFDQVEVPVPLRRAHANAADTTLTVGFQGCQTDGICYPPMTRTLALSLPAGTVTPAPTAGERPASTVTGIAAKASPSPQPSPASGRGSQVPTQAEDTRLAAALAGTSKAWTLLGFFGAGLLLAFTPCVLPMIPILSGLIAGRGERIGARRAFSLSFIYVLANALVFTVAGVVAGLVGANLQAAFQTPWVLIAFAALFVALSLSMFGLYELQLPASWRARLGALSDHQRGGSWIGVAAMGALSALIVGPCVAPPLAAAVLYIGQTRDPVLGGAALFLLAMGMGVPLLAFGVAAGRGMPTSGPWMLAIQRVFGFVFLGLAIWMLSRILPASAVLGLWGLLALAAAAWAFSAATTPRTRMAARFAALVLGVIGAAQLVGALGGGRDPLQPLAGMSGAQRAQELEFKLIKSVEDLDRELATAQAAGKPLLFDFYADWCVACKEMEKYTFTEPAVHAALVDFVLLKADVTANDDVDQALMQRFGIIGPPSTLFFIDNHERRELRLIGYEKAGLFVERAQRAAH